jgi:hypothetical protein
MTYSSENVGWPLHLMDFSSSPAVRKSSFGDNGGQLLAGSDHTLMRKIMGVAPSSFWAYHITKYQVTRYAPDGKIQVSIRREPRWFPGESPWSIGSPTIPPPPIVQAATVRNDTVWVATAVARPDWQRAWRRNDLQGLTELSARQRPNQSELYLSRIEVIDSKAGTVVARRDFEGTVVDIDRQLRAAVYQVTANAEPRLQLYSLRLKR